MKATKKRVGLAVLAVVVCALGVSGWWWIASLPYIRFVRFEKKEDNTVAVFRLVNPSSTPYVYFAHSREAPISGFRSERLTSWMDTRFSSFTTERHGAAVEVWSHSDVPFELAPKSGITFSEIAGDCSYSVGVRVKPAADLGQQPNYNVFRDLGSYFRWTAYGWLSRWFGIDVRRPWSDYTPVPPAQGVDD